MFIKREGQKMFEVFHLGVVEGSFATLAEAVAFIVEGNGDVEAIIIAPNGEIIIPTLPWE